MNSTAPQSAARFSFRLPDGREVSGPVQGAGGVVSKLSQLVAAKRRAEAGRPTGIYEPAPGCVAVYVAYSAASNGAAVIVMLAALVDAVTT